MTPESGDAADPSSARDRPEDACREAAISLGARVGSSAPLWCRTRARAGGWSAQAQANHARPLARPMLRGGA